jgi:hypothetical protein
MLMLAISTYLAPRNMIIKSYRTAFVLPSDVI